MRTLKYAILGLLNRRPMTGYDIGKEFNYELSEFWYAKHSQIYPELKRLAKEEFVTYDIEISGDILEKKQYSITEKGQKELLMWLHKDEIIEKTPKDVFRLRMYFSNNLDLESRIHLLESQKMQHKKRLYALQKILEQYPVVPDYNSDRFGDFIILEGAIIRQESLLKWLDKCIDYCKKAQEEK
ncbi:MULTISPECIES: PadR family transcriptional regulator [Psychrilyobacter]|uniref:PadR family transcriptional regulator n=1 Tax=Psychrilyobacter piezotolerans TaxID=2293438 RepID=A0ABX9KHZ4_9FUSO|nr:MULTISPECIES: PadR family transcriptional regulator [Psychrilyobacter]MCS5422976.1 PadR family transcriptional regulator [Psychrilyobacter sp. S5]NDI77499.1 PadR family transcriptional regulator [Psychrilyobacter piezotolerans]RDE62988.1 PadR family transcriptional regulator [Psychrilyobacter sp. S5]REI41746.1 PadR family transcriptional regulator [Psychrilyobacter piezotolerans]